MRKLSVVPSPQHLALKDHTLVIHARPESKQTGQHGPYGRATDIRHMMSVATISFATVLLFAPTPPRAEPVDMPVEEWREIALGRTLTYRIDGEFFALERYAERGDRVWLQLVDGTCLEGRWSYEAPLYCYFWTGFEPVCFRHVRNSDRVLVLETEDGVETGETQTMAGISDTPLTCAPMLSS